MATVNIVNIGVLNNPAPLVAPFKFEVSFECLAPLAEDLEVRVVYVGSAETSNYDQELLSVLVGPIPVGTNMVMLESAAPDPSKIPPADLLGVTVVLLTVSYRGKEFVRVGYYVSNENPDMVEDGMAPPPVDPHRVVRNVVADKPRVTRFDIDWA